MSRKADDMAGTEADLAATAMRFLMPYALAGGLPSPIVIEGQCSILRRTGSGDEAIAQFRKIIADVLGEAAALRQHSGRA